MSIASMMTKRYRVPKDANLRIRGEAQQGLMLLSTDGVLIVPELPVPWASNRLLWGKLPLPGPRRPQPNPYTVSRPALRLV